MSRRTYDLYGMGNAVVDVEYRVNDTYLNQHDLEKRRMKLVDQTLLLSLVEDLESLPISRKCGGSVANTLYALSGFGHAGFMSCRVAPDSQGHYYASQLIDAGIDTNPIGESNGFVTGQCLILITPDAERTMNTCLGISNLLSTTELDESALSQSDGLYIEGYLASSTSATDAAKYAHEFADEHKVESNLTLSDTSIVNAFRENLEIMLGNGVNRLFSNLEEACAWCKTDRLDVCLTELKDIANEVVITLGKKGCAVNYHNQRFESPSVPAYPSDTNGAGDIFAAGYLSAIFDQPHVDREEAAHFANYAASELIVVEGARFDSLDKYAQIKDHFRDC